MSVNNYTKPYQIILFTTNWSLKINASWSKQWIYKKEETLVRQVRDLCIRNINYDTKLLLALQTLFYRVRHLEFQVSGAEQGGGNAEVNTLGAKEVATNCELLKVSWTSPTPWM